MISVIVWKKKKEFVLHPALTIILPVFLSWKCCLLFMSAAYIQEHLRLEFVLDLALTIIPPEFLSWKFVCFYVCCICSSTLQTRFYHGSKHYEPWSDCFLGSSLIWVHIVCKIGCLRTYADEMSIWQKSWLAGKELLINVCSFALVSHGLSL